MGALVILVLVAFVVIAILAWYFDEERRAKRALRSIPAMPIAEAPEGGVVKVCGTLRYAGEPIVAPLSGRSCAAFLVEVEEHQRSGKQSRWRTIITERNAVDFLVEGADGHALVRASGAQLVLVRDARFTSGVFNDATPELERYLARHGHHSTGLFGFNKAIRYKEGVLEEGEEVAVLGLARWEHDPDVAAAGGGYRERPRRLVLDLSDQGQLLVSDDASVLG